MSISKPHRSQCGLSIGPCPSAVRAHIGVEQDLAILAERHPAVRAQPVLPLEIPFAPALRAAVMRDHLDLAVHDVTLGGGVVPRGTPHRLRWSKGRYSPGAGRPGLAVEDIDQAREIHAVMPTEALVEIAQHPSDLTQFGRIQQSIEGLGEAINGFVGPSPRFLIRRQVPLYV